MQVYIKNRVRRKDEFQFFMHDFVDCCKENGFETVPDLFPSYKYHIRSVLKRLELLLYKCIRRVITRKNKALIVTANGSTIAENFFPYFFNYELIPFLWDVWPSKWRQMQHDFNKFGVRIVFVTARSVVKMINEKMSGTKAFWIPEGIDVSHYRKGDVLENRPYNVLELGRQMKRYHEVLSEMKKEGNLKEWTTSMVNSDGTLSQERLTFTDNEMLYAEFPKYKVIVCFPRCDTNPSYAGNVETLTQRYWEAMLSGCLMIGRAPQELIDVIGYNPVIDANWENPKEQLMLILENISNYQSFIEKNYEAARKYASWDSRIRMIKDILETNGYKL